MKTVLEESSTPVKGNFSTIGVSIVILFLIILFREPLFGMFGEQNSLAIHLIMEFFIVTLAFTIAFQSWFIFPYVRSSFGLWMGALFFAIGILEIAHVITYEGMPFFVSEYAYNRAIWLFIIARLTEVAAMLCIVSFDDREINSKYRYFAYGFAFVYALFCIAILFYPTSFFTALVQEGLGTTLVRNLPYVGMALKLVLIYIVFIRYRANKLSNYMLIPAITYLLIADFFFLSFSNVHNIKNFIGHWFQLAGFYFLQRAVYYTFIVEPFQKQKQTESLLKQNEKFLELITDHMGEGLMVIDPNGNLAFMNPEGERILGWKEEELLGRNVHDYIHRSKDGSHYPYNDCPSLKANKKGEVYRIDEDYFITKSGRLIPVSYVATPLYEDGKAMGSITVFRDITKMKENQEMIHFMAFYDELTNLPNIRYLKEKWDDITEKFSSSKIALFTIDIDRFKSINEALGHAVGDLILKGVSKRLQDHQSVQENLFRLTGDEFLLLLPIEEKSQILDEFEQIQQHFVHPLQAQHILLNVSISCGVAIYPENGRDIDTLLQHGNIALMEAQSQNKSFQFYESYMDGKALDNLVFENDLGHAIVKKQLHIVYQPQVDLKKGEIIGLEALIRWHHPTYGWISPGRFISKAEDTGLIIPIGEWVLQTACEQMKQWHDQGFPPWRIAVNLSIRQFYQHDLIGKIKQILQKTGLSPQYLELEITESVMMNIDHSKKILQGLKELGIQISIDDFGTGYSSLSYLKYLPVNRLKIDKSFVSDLVDENSDMTIISAIISMAKYLNIEVIAEGVETITQKDMLQNDQCTQIQGYLISKPLPPKELLEQFSALQQKVRNIAKGESES